MDFTRLFVCIPLLYVGHLMATNPVGFLSLADSLAIALQRFGWQLKGHRGQVPFYLPDPARHSTFIRNSVRVAGFLVALAGLAYFYLPFTIGTNRTA
jgi:hypothetical protein